MPIDALSVSLVQLTRDLLVIAKFLYDIDIRQRTEFGCQYL